MSVSERRGRPPLLHPWLAPLPPILSLAVLNGQHVGFTAVLWSIVVAWAFVGTLWAALAALTGNVAKSAALATVVTMVLLGGGGVARTAAASAASGPVLWTGVLVALVLGAWLARGRAQWTFFLNVLLLGMTVFSGSGFVRSALARSSPTLPGDRTDRSIGVVVPPTQYPDVYVLVMDGYGREDVLSAVYGYDNDLIGELRTRGFAVADRAASNYAQTASSLASELNLEYLPDLLDTWSPTSRARVPLGQLIEGNLVFRSFKATGYRIVTYASEYGLVKPAPRDELRRPRLYLTEFEYGLYDQSALPELSRSLGFQPAYAPHRIRWAHVRWTLDRLSEAEDARDGRPTLVFAHILLPHPPFVFGSDGSFRPTGAVASLWDGSHWNLNATRFGDQYRHGYVEAVRFANKRLSAVLEAIVERAERPTIVLVHGDHGPGARLDWNDPHKSDLTERLGILLALRLPGNEAHLPATLTPINAMRLVVNHALGAHLPMLEDRSYFATWDRPYDFTEATEAVQAARVDGNLSHCTTLEGASSETARPTGRVVGPAP